MQHECNMHLHLTMSEGLSEGQYYVRLFKCSVVIIKPTVKTLLVRLLFEGVP